VFLVSGNGKRGTFPSCVNIHQSFLRTKMSKQSTINYKAQYNNVIDSIRDFGFNMRTNFITEPDGSVRGNGISIKLDPSTATKYTTGSHGTCVKDNLTIFVKLSKAGAKFYHGECRSRINEWATTDENKGMPVYHCWVEMGEKVYDYSNGKKMVCDTDLFYQKYRVRKSEQVRVEVVEHREKKGISLETHVDEVQRERFCIQVRASQRTFGYFAPAGK